MNGAFMVVFTRISHRELQDTDIERPEAKSSAKERKNMSTRRATKTFLRKPVRQKQKQK